MPVHGCCFSCHVHREGWPFGGPPANSTVYCFLFVLPCRFEPTPEWLRMMEAVQGELEEEEGCSSGDQGRPVAMLSASAAAASIAPELDDQLAAQQHEGAAAQPWQLDAQEGQEGAAVVEAAGAGDSHSHHLIAPPI